MKREEFLKQLEQLLDGISEEEKADALAFYRSYFEDAGEENEESVIAELESPEKVAQSIKKNLGMEKENGFFEMADSLVETLGLDETNELNLIISRILQEDLTDSVLFLTGVGKCHPIIASHNILNNLHQVLDSVPVVLFYPGEYSGQDLKLFGTMDSHNYYRAFRLV